MNSETDQENRIKFHTFDAFKIMWLVSITKRTLELYSTEDRADANVMFVLPSCRQRNQ